MERLLVLAVAARAAQGEERLAVLQHDGWTQGRPWTLAPLDDVRVANCYGAETGSGTSLSLQRIATRHPRCQAAIEHEDLAVPVETQELICGADLRRRAIAVENDERAPLRKLAKAVGRLVKRERARTGNVSLLIVLWRPDIHENEPQALIEKGLQPVGVDGQDWKGWRRAVARRGRLSAQGKGHEQERAENASRRAHDGWSSRTGAAVSQAGR